MLGALAHRFPERVQWIFLLGAAINHPLDHTNPYVRALFLASRTLHDNGESCLAHLKSLCSANQAHPPVPETIIYSRRDQIVDWRACLESGEQVQAFEVNSGH